ncbi:MAG TPA: hypothetical protein VJL35_16725 [Gemmatimonadaceae bacterium]|jgi:hypothetical protein|nr:hypothetical protein [Gemmatimonadaceae bacterium]
MTKVSKPWKIAGFLFVLVNVGGAIYGLAMNDWIHAFWHVAAMAAGFMGWQFFAYRNDDAEPVSELHPEARLDSLQNAVDSIALNVERIGEAQRYQEKLVKERTRTRGSP